MKEKKVTGRNRGLQEEIKTFTGLTGRNKGLRKEIKSSNYGLKEEIKLREEKRLPEEMIYRNK